MTSGRMNKEEVSLRSAKPPRPDEDKHKDVDLSLASLARIEEGDEEEWPDCFKRSAYNDESIQHDTCDEGSDSLQKMREEIQRVLLGYSSPQTSPRNYPNFVFKPDHPPKVLNSNHEVKTENVQTSLAARSTSSPTPAPRLHATRKQYRKGVSHLKDQEEEFCQMLQLRTSMEKPTNKQVSCSIRHDGTFSIYSEDHKKIASLHCSECSVRGLRFRPQVLFVKSLESSSKLAHDRWSSAAYLVCADQKSRDSWLLHFLSHGAKEVPPPTAIKRR
ncbi:hypothetical protein GUITHDRAFT_111084 [Guillardia theta CCMP2712]|uniref:Uncharacterized protein n=1 Tax=Guillardia theta (strain CCMP2712) TaxID=905079 RepID=L1J3E9_GUITC|nr:hypothetical protein GUITHDRAFT_111084 [Guillardia theta CCMP2712]EKX43041.1 hypothetical protein GUITHDRAFT_111084 [Guillardia theta CCMP2712]|eukprot:XP_005830021.1 hypothetical protein GUITHDRAFT_111084 [Guillardia theta CCMP2712]